MQIQFDPNQEYQRDAVNAVLDLFDGQSKSEAHFSVVREYSLSTQLSGLVRTERALGNQLTLTEPKLRQNCHAVQERNDIDSADSGIPLEGWELPSLGTAGDVNFLPARPCLHFSVEMETGTGKTYVYIRTIFELSRKYGFKKFIIVVPSVAIREGVLKNLQITADHFKAIYNNLEYEYFTYDARKVNRLRQFAVSNQVQILVINIDAFRKNFTGTEAEQKSNVIYKENDKLSGRQPIEFVQATHPIVIVDEPQSVDNTEKAQEAIRALNPLCTLRYSATHKNPYNLVYKLDPIRAYELRLVKQIVVASVTGQNAFNDAYVKVKAIDYETTGKRPFAKLEIHVHTRDGVKEKTFKVKGQEDLFMLSGEREIYRNGFVVDYVDATPGSEHVAFTNGRTLNIGQEQGGLRDDLWKVQIKSTIKKHFEKELQVKGKGLKVLSLFFIDRVSNYRDYAEDGSPLKGKFATFFEEAFKELAAQERYKDLLPFPVEQLHDGYFATDKKGVFKESREGRATEADESAYELIMQKKELLLSLDVPLRFIFSHSALREGWDNPNVFQICTLNESRSALRKRQEIGRGLRLPVNQNGERVFDEAINKLLIIANESYDEFARALQTEYEQDCGVTFGKVPKLAFARLTRMDGEVEKPLGRETSETIWTGLVKKGFITEQGKLLPAFDPKTPGFDLGLAPEHAELKSDIVDVLQSYQLDRHIKKDQDERPLRFKKEVSLDPGFQELWNRIKPKTTFSVNFETKVLTENAVKSLKTMDKIAPVRVTVTEAKLDLENKGVTATVLRDGRLELAFHGAMPDIIAYLQNETELTRSTIVRILRESGRLQDFLVNPQRFMDSAAAILNRELHKLMIDGIKYEKLADDEWNMRLFEEREIVSYLNNRLEVQHSIYDAVVYDSEIEREFAEKLDQREDIKVFVKLPAWFEIETPIGKYNPDWAILKHDDAVLYLVRETKGTRNFEKLRTSEAEKVRCGRKHFDALGVNFDVVTSVAELD
jgi:type III restriction enzyme